MTFTSPWLRVQTLKNYKMAFPCSESEFIDFARKEITLLLVFMIFSVFGGGLGRGFCDVLYAIKSHPQDPIFPELSLFSPAQPTGFLNCLLDTWKAYVLCCGRITSISPHVFLAIAELPAVYSIKT
jgi:hypothetical protein